MKQRYIEGGRVRTAPTIDRGAPLVFTEEEWRERFSTFQRGMQRSLLVLLLAIYVALIIPIVVATAGTPGVPIELPIFLFILMTCVVWVPGLMSMAANRYWTSRMPAPGLYEAGVQVGPFIFVPYGEVASLEPVDRVPGGGRWGGKAIKMHPRFKRKPFPGVEMPGYWFLKVEFLGNEGVAELERRVMGPREEDIEPPKLVLYGRRGANR